LIYTTLELQSGSEDVDKTEIIRTEILAEMKKLKESTRSEMTALRASQADILEALKTLQKSVEDSSSNRTADTAKSQNSEEMEGKKAKQRTQLKEIWMEGAVGAQSRLLMLRMNMTRFAQNKRHPSKREPTAHLCTTFNDLSCSASHQPFDPLESASTAAHARAAPRRPAHPSSPIDPARALAARANTARNQHCILLT
jgi:hypothetical protein